MDLYLYLQAKDISTISFQTPLKSFLNNDFKDLLIFEADQDSDLQHIQNGTKFIEVAGRIIFHIEDDGKTSLGSIMKLLEQLRRSNGTKLLIYSGETTMIKNSLKILGADIIQDNFEDEIRSFLQ